MSRTTTQDFSKDYFQLPFTKMEGLGNDYIYVNGFQYRVENPAALSQKISDRHFGVGGDGLVLILPAENGSIADGQLRMRMFNADGSEAEMCGNAIRCVGKYAFERSLTTKRDLTVETLAGLKYLTLLGEGNSVSAVQVDMGPPILQNSLIPIRSNSQESLEQAIQVLGEDLCFTGVSMGNPHAVFVVPEITDHQILTLGPVIEKHEMFPKKINVEFIRILSREEIEMRVWERGSGETLACGTGACAAAVAAIRLGKCDRRVQVQLRGGSLNILWPDQPLAEELSLKANHVYMSGPAEFVFDGSLLLR